jgi:subtilisin family serine protease
MRYTIRSYAIIFQLLFFSFLAFSSAYAAKPAGPNINDHVQELLSHEYIEREIIVKFKNEVALDNLRFNSASSRAHSATGAAVKRNFRKLNGLQLVKLRGDRSMKDALKAYLENPEVEYAEPNYIVNAALSPNDPNLYKLWGLNNTGQTGGTSDADIDAVEAWDITTGSSNVVIAVIDSGVAINSNISVGHPELNDNIWTNPGETSCTDGIDNDSNGYIDDCFGWDFIDNDNDPMDYAGHGTHVAGTIAAVGNNNQGITGVMWDASIMPLRFLDAAGSGNTADAISAINYAAANGAHVMNNSWGGGGFSQSLEDAINASGILAVCAAGNSGLNNDATPFYPASYSSDNIISVAATDHNDNLASFSNYGATSVDIAAPGVSIYSTFPARNRLIFDDMTNLNNWIADAPTAPQTALTVITQKTPTPHLKLPPPLTLQE